MPSTRQELQSEVLAHKILSREVGNLPTAFSQRWLMQTAPQNYIKMVAQIKLCKRSFKITCSSFSTLKMDLQSICHVMPGSSAISVGSESSKPQIILIKKVFET